MKTLIQTRMTMSTKTNAAAAAALLAALAAPEISFAQAMPYLNASPQSGVANVPAVFGSAIAPTQRRAPRTTVPPSDRALTDPSGNIISLPRDWGSGQD